MITRNVDLTEPTQDLNVRLAAGAYVCIEVADNGPGVAESIRQTMFLPFVSEGKPSGIGLGLALAHKIAQEHGGSVTLEESRKGHTVFSLSLAQSKLREFAAAAQPPENPVAVT